MIQLACHLYFSLFILHSLYTHAQVYNTAYRQHRSYETVFLKVVNDILWFMEELEVNAFVATDLSAALDTVGPCNTLKHYGE